MSLGAGETEAHVLKLSCALASMGHKVTVASNGGEHTKELEAHGIPHISVPLHKKDPISLANSYFILKALIKKEDFDIVHAHARIPAFVCGQLQKALKFRFITSAHNEFKVTSLYKRTSNWGEHCISASEEIKQYIIDNYGMCADNISVITHKEDDESAQMAKCHVEAYKKLMPFKHYKHGDIVISGYYGYGNTGDDSLLLSIIETLRAQDTESRITVITKAPKKIQKRFGVRCISRINIFAIANELSHAKLLISGGGSILQNSTSNRSLIYYTSVIALAKKLGTRVMLYSNGIGPLIGENAKRRAARAIKNADAITLREPYSFEELSSLGIDKRCASVTADPALLLSPAEESRIKFISKNAGILDNKHYFAVSLREWRRLRNLMGSGDSNASELALADAIDKISMATGAEPIFIPMQPSRDSAICERIRSMCKAESIFLSHMSAKELMGILKMTDFVIGMRLHILIYATAVGVPVLGLAYDPKIDAFLEYSEQRKAIGINDLTSEALVSALKEITSNHEAIKEKIETKCAELRILAKEDAKTAIDLVNKND